MVAFVFYRALRLKDPLLARAFDIGGYEQTHTIEDGLNMRAIRRLPCRIK